MTSLERAICRPLSKSHELRNSVITRYPVPSCGPMAAHFNIDIKMLRSLLRAYATDNIYSYVIATIETQKSVFHQAGSGPNFLGDAVTLCTCKHWMRTFRSVADWKDVWVAGFCTVVANGGQHALVYLMRVAAAYESQRELWKHLTPDSRVQKSARVNPLGDVYHPKRGPGDPLVISSYHPPLLGHSHRRNARDWSWRNDIAYSGMKRNAALLIGAPQQTFLWNQSRVLYLDEKSHSLGRGQKKLSLGEFIGRLGA